MAPRRPAPNLRAATWSSYRAELRRHVLPHLGELPLQQLTPVHLNQLTGGSTTATAAPTASRGRSSSTSGAARPAHDSSAHGRASPPSARPNAPCATFYAQLLTAGRRDGAGGLSARTVRYIHTVLRKALADGVRWGRLERNVADLADPPRQVASRHGGHMQIWSAEQLRTFLDHVRDDRLHPAWLLAATTGMRRGEILGLRWVDVDFATGRLAVRQTYVSIDGHAQFSEPKTRRSRRTIDLDLQTTAVLRDWRDRQETERAAWGRA